MRRCLESARNVRAFTLIELLIVIAIIGVLVGLILSGLARSKQIALRTQCASNMRQLEMAQVAYAADQEDLIIAAGDGTEQGSWIGSLVKYGAAPEARKCPADRSPYYQQPLPGTSPARKRTTSYAINNYVSPTHAPFGADLVRKLSQVGRSSTVIHLAELAETGALAGSDHLHVDEFYLVFAPQISISLIDKQLALGRHGGRAATWDAVLNFSFLDGHAESMPIRQVYTNPKNNLFIPRLTNR